VLVNNLNLFLDSDNIIRSKGRLAHCKQFDYETNNPILLPKDSFLTSLYVYDAHIGCKHMGVPSTLARLRKSGYWVPRGRATIKTVLSNCVTCKKINSFAFTYPRPNDYVKGRVNFEYVYQNTGIDFTGHIFVKMGGKVSKMYILVYTCLNIRAIHIDVLPDLSVNNFLLSFIRFTNRYGRPRAIFSDNASTFLMALGILKKSTTDDAFSDHLIKNNIQHFKIPLYAAWIGSAWERMIKTLKSCIHKTVGRKHLAYFEIVTLLSDIQNSINDRPLTYYENDPGFVCISPNSFLKPSSSTTGTLQLEGQAGTELLAPTRKELIKTLESREEILDTMKTRWAEEYLLGLRETAREMYQTSWENKIELGEVVLISAPNKSRPHWHLGRVIELLPGQDGKVRTVRLRRPDRTDGVYAIKTLFPLEIRSHFTEEPCAQDSNINANNLKIRPQRLAAINCRDRLKLSN